MSAFYVTFGQQYVREPHATFPDAHPDGYVTLIAPDEATAREFAFELFGTAWSFLYDARPPAPLYPRDSLAMFTHGEDFRRIYLWANAKFGDRDVLCYAMAEDGTVLGSHLCSSTFYMRHDLHDRPDRREACRAHYPDGYLLVVLPEWGQSPPDEVYARNQAQAADHAAAATS